MSEQEHRPFDFGSQLPDKPYENEFYSPKQLYDFVCKHLNNQDMDKKKKLADFLLTNEKSIRDRIVDAILIEANQGKEAALTLLVQFERDFLLASDIQPLKGDPREYDEY